jgi:hypothetical protein
MLHKKSASERIEAFVIAENIKDNGEGANVDYSSRLEDQTISELRTCEVELGKLRKIVEADDKSYERMLRTATDAGVKRMQGNRDRKQSGRVLLSEVDDALMCKLYAVEVAGDDSELWDYMLQFTELLRNKLKYKKVLREVRAKKHSVNPS